MTAVQIAKVINSVNCKSNLQVKIYTCILFILFLSVHFSSRSSTGELMATVDSFY